MRIEHNIPPSAEFFFSAGITTFPFHFLLQVMKKWVLHVNRKRKKKKKEWIPQNENSFLIRNELVEIWKAYHCRHLFPATWSGKRIITPKVSCIAKQKGVSLQHDNAREHSSKQPQEKMRSLGWEFLSHPPSTNDLVATFVLITWTFHIWQNI